MAHGFLSYVRYWENWVQWAIILGVFLCAVSIISRGYSGNEPELEGNVRNYIFLDAECDDFERYYNRPCMATSCGRHRNILGLAGADDVSWTLSNFRFICANVYERCVTNNESFDIKKLIFLFSVAVNFAKFLLAYCCLLIAFGLSFGVIFSNYPAFQHVPW